MMIGFKSMQQIPITWPPVYVVKKHKRARHVKLRATKKFGLVVTTPWRFPERDVSAVLEVHKEWIMQQLAVLRIQSEAALPEKIDLLSCNQSIRVEYISASGRLRLIERPGHELVLYGDLADRNQSKSILIKWLREQATRFLSAKLLAVSERVGLPFKTVTVRDQQTLWGSCTRDKAINLSYRLIFLPPQLVEHVMIHELCHTIHLNHSAKFWSLVAKYDINWQQNRVEMRKASQYIPEWI